MDTNRHHPAREPRRWHAIKDAPLTVRQAKHMRERGELLTAQRREGDTFTLLAKSPRQAPAA